MNRARRRARIEATITALDKAVPARSTAPACCDRWKIPRASNNAAPVATVTAVALATGATMPYSQRTAFRIERDGPDELDDSVGVLFAAE